MAPAVLPTLAPVATARASAARGSAARAAARRFPASVAVAQPGALAAARLPARRGAAAPLRAVENGAAPVAPSKHGAPAVPVTGVAVFSAAPYVRDFFEGVCAPWAGRTSTQLLRARIDAFVTPLCVGCAAAPLMAAFPGSTFIEARLSKETAVLARGANVVCLFVNDDWCGVLHNVPRWRPRQAMHAYDPPRLCVFAPACSDDQICLTLAQQGVKLVAMRCAGFDRVDVAAAAAHGIQVVRVPSYSPHAARLVPLARPPHPRARAAAPYAPSFASRLCRLRSMRSRC
jgi:hypothetical protein